MRVMGGCRQSESDWGGIDRGRVKGGGRQSERDGGGEGG